jgi:hypothetical protein
VTAVADVVAMDDPELISERARIRTELEQLSPKSDNRGALECLYDVTNQEIDHRASAAWSTA